MELPEARLGRRRNLRPLVYAALIGAAAWFCGPAVTAVVVGVGAFLGVVGWGMKWWLEEQEKAAVSESALPPEGELVYPLRPGAVVIVSVVVCGCLAISALATGDLWFGTVTGVLALALTCRVVVASTLAQRIVVTERELTLPISQWSGEVVTVPLASVYVHAEEDDPFLRIECWPLQRAFSSQWIGGGGATELALVLKTRAARCKVA